MAEESAKMENELKTQCEVQREVGRLHTQRNKLKTWWKY